MPALTRSASAGPSSKRALSPVVEERAAKRSKPDEDLLENASPKRSLRDKKKRKRKKKKSPVSKGESDTPRVGDDRSGQRPPSSRPPHSSTASVPTSEAQERKEDEVGEERSTASVAVSSTERISILKIEQENATSSSSRSNTLSDVAPDNVESMKPAVDPPKVDKGKGKAREIPSESIPDAISTVPVLPESSTSNELQLKSELISKHETVFSQFQQSLTCQICLDLLHKPYALAPCGHIACYDCLVSWFTTAPLDGNLNPPPVPRRSKKCPHCRAIVRERPAFVWSVKELVSTLVKSGLAKGLPVSSEEATDATGIPLPNTNPVAANADGVPAARGRDPWENIFKKPSAHAHLHLPHFPDLLNAVGANQLPPMGVQHPEAMGMLDAEDGGIWRCFDCMHEIWDGVCSSCGRIYPGHLHHGHDGDPVVYGGDYEDIEDWSEDDDDDDGVDDGDMGNWYGSLFPLYVDSEDEDGSDDGIAVHGHHHHHHHHHPAHHPALIQNGDDHHLDDDDVGEGDETDRSYESSFIDDENDRGIPREGEVIDLAYDSDESGSDHPRLAPRRHAPAPRRRAPAAATALIVSESDDSGESGEEDDYLAEDPYLGRHTERSRILRAISRRDRAIVISSSDEDDDGGEDEEDEGEGGADVEVVEIRDESDGDDEVVEVRSVGARVGGRGGGRRRVVVVESDDDESGDDGHILNGVVDPIGDNEGRLDDLDEDHPNPTLADLVAAQERELYGDDGSIPRRPSPLFVVEEPEVGSFDHGDEDDMSDRNDPFSEDERRSYYDAAPLVEESDGEGDNYGGGGYDSFY
ncbi:hypothetical protein JAAARDRAFT_81664 [Jaapia argillacea MUCL 33604]|uniref:RING-type domain-containing protein n=1 Tax=Jaapia argillacea MUCL 33604 TaxID=933084 RepID=A0A067PIZ4_9AGAM|nr:hypothetical protein JAAARDRAFT_81664 [Jaapia argillacea MUCL 33604]